MKTLLVVTAHPDDETFFFGGTIATYAQLGWNVVLLVVTNGEAGKNAVDPSLMKNELSEIRLRELEKACSILGVSSRLTLGFADGKLNSCEPGEIEDVLYEKLCTIIPDVVLTFSPTGFTGHPDHLKVYRSTTYAFQKYSAFIAEKVKIIENMHASGNSQTEETEMVQPKLYYSVLPSSIASYLIRNKVLPLEMYGQPLTGTHDKFISTIIDIMQVQQQKFDAAKAHASQEKDIERFANSFDHPLMKNEYFVLRYDGIIEAFAGKNDIVSGEL